MVWTSRLWNAGSTCLLGAVSALYSCGSVFLRAIVTDLLFRGITPCEILLLCATTLTPHNIAYPVYFLSSPILYSIAGLGIAIVNDFKSIEGDRALGLQSLPVAFGIDKAKWICAGSVTVTQLFVALYLYAIGEPTYAAILLGLILPQVYFQATLLLPDPVANDVKYQASSQPFLVFGILATALAIGHHDFAA